VRDAGSWRVQLTDADKTPKKCWPPRLVLPLGSVRISVPPLRQARRRYSDACCPYDEQFAEEYGAMRAQLSAARQAAQLVQAHLVARGNCPPIDQYRPSAACFSAAARQGDDFSIANARASEFVAQRLSQRQP